MQGFIASVNASPVSITSAFANGIELAVSDTVGSQSLKLPQACYWSHISVKGDETVATAAEVEAVLTWDAEGDDIIIGPTGLTAVFNGITDASLRSVAFKIDAYVRATEEQANVGSVYLWLRTDAGTMTVAKDDVKLHWAIRSRG